MCPARRSADDDARRSAEDDARDLPSSEAGDARDLPASEADDAATLAEVGEGEVLRRIFPRLPHSAAELLGPGDDCAVLAAPDGRFVVTTDTMVQGPDFRLAWSTAHDIGWKAAMTNLADVAAMGARPTGLVVAIAAPLDTPVSVLLGIADGLREACLSAAPGCGVVGGDLSTSSALTIAVTAFGSLDGGEPVTRAGARPGDVVAVAGELGLAGAGIWLLFRDGTHDADADGDSIPDARRGRALRRHHGALLEAQLAPRVPVALGVTAREAGATAMLDVSDGLTLDARRLARASGCTVRLDSAAIEREAAALRAVDPIVGERATAFVLSGGEDHALLATFPASVPLPEGFRPLGAVTAGEPDVLVGEVPSASLGGWDPYADWDGRAG